MSFSTQKYRDYGATWLDTKRLLVNQKMQKFTCESVYYELFFEKNFKIIGKITERPYLCGRY
jgi:hypothetical protein